MGRTTFTTITPLPSSLTRETALEFLHDHLQMIDLNPLVIERHPISPPPHALPEEQQCVWYSLTDKISYLPGGMMTGQVSYTCAFHDIPQGLQTHCYAPMGLDIRDRWSVGGSMPGEPQEPVELGLNAPPSGLYLREDVELRCNFIMASFVKKTMKQSHGTLVDKLAEKANIAMFSKSTQDVGSDAWTSEASTPSSAWMVPQGIPPVRSDTAATPLPGPLLPVPKIKKSVPTPGPPYHQQHSDQAFGPYGYQTPPRAVGSQQDAKAQPQPQVSQPQPQPLSDGQSTHSRDELFHPERASGSSQQSFSLQPPSNPQAKIPPETLSHSEQVSKPPATTPIVHPPPDSQSNNTSREELFHPENTPGNHTSFSLTPPTDPKAQAVQDKVSEPQHSFIIEPPAETQAKSSREELFHPENASRPQGTFILRPPSDPRITESPGGLSYSGTVYRGKSRPEHYTEFAGSNPYEV